MPTLQQLRYLVAVAETLHFRRAAELTHVTQPTLSGQLRELEEKLGVQLVERSRARVILTPIGTEIAGRAKGVLRDVQEIVEVAKHEQNLMGGTIRLGVLPSLGPYLLPHILPELHRRFPDLKFYVREGLPQALLGGLDDGSYDLLLFPLPVTGSDIAHTRLFRESLLVVAPTDHRLAKKQQVEQTDLKDETVLTLERGHRLHDQVHELCAQYGAKLALDYEGTSLDTLRQMVGMGMGLSLLPALYVRSEVSNDDQVVARHLRTRRPFRMIGMVWRRHSARQDEFQALAELIREIISEGVPEVTVLR
ncbi:hydrogen peroxide-inducible genes activator [Denitrobaculum tricleocarpae]|uniref:Hydrogen peroxide-inducible genes activator n=1 Tax=Denitrobaculum tricleocarpae TaxID=2591009 RepID=A0A545TMX5_9PROT|nr:hydrogen peroxide-inducible genes activator [Denitrobaculum tricleocarpae]TQV78501.1 hydrogen peroxide-inducible genes activator [Denitrobaculum tricleocarpae]